MYFSTLIHFLLAKADLISAPTLLDCHKRLYVYQLLSFPNEHPTKQILQISLRIGDGVF